MSGRRKTLLVLSLAGLFVLFTAAGLAQAQSVSAVPAAPTSVSASPTVPLQQVSVSWAASTDSAVVGYYVYRNGGFVTETPNANIIDTAPPGTYTYTVAAFTAAGAMSPQSTASAPVTIIKDVTPPTAPVWISLVPATSSVMLTWTASTDNIGVVGYYLYRNGNKVPLPTPISGTTYDDVGLLPGNSFTYALVAFDAAGNTATSQTMHASTLSDLTPPSMPSLLHLAVKSPTEIDLTWQASTDNVGVVGYYIYLNSAEIATVSSTPTAYASTGLSPATTYAYTVAAFDAAGNVSAQSYLVQAATLAADTTPPSIPHYFYATPVSASEIDLTWQASTDNVGVVGYYLDRNGGEIAALGSATSTSYQDTGLATDTTYSYTVQAYDASGNISAPNTVSATTLAQNPVTTPTPAATPPPVSINNLYLTPTPTSPATPSPNSGTTNNTTIATPPLFYFSTALYFGLSNNAVKNLQIFLIEDGYLGQGYDTGYFGALTQKAVEQFQCAQAIICSGNPGTTGWGSVGPRTRAALNGS
ncbi:MAG TPA: fibronectin type III domain-containing protein [Candidatus Paceibacterota bacterium]|nr:fibronectin type III domain-containing protein [Candidatus Paceibacterota bacterium]